MILPAVVLPASFTIQLWIRQYPCSIDTTETVLTKPNHFRWIYKTSGSNPSYIFELFKGAISITGQEFQAIVFDKWMHFTIIANPNSFTVYKNGKQRVITSTISSSSYQTVITPQQIYLGTDELAANRFEGNFREFRLWSRCLTWGEAYANFDRSLMPTELYDIILYFKLDEGSSRAAIVTDTKTPSLTSVGTNMFIWERLSDDPVCCKEGTNCGGKKWNGLLCTDDRKFLYFDKTYLLPLPSFSVPATSSTVISSFWYKFVEPEPKDGLTGYTYPVTLAFLTGCMQITLDYSYTDKSQAENLARLIFADLSGTQQVTMVISKQQHLWMHLIAYKRPASPIYLRANMQNTPSNMYKASAGNAANHLSTV